MSKVKNLALLINVFNELPEFTLTIIGDGDEKQYLKNIANKNVLFIDSIENSKLKDEFQKNDIFILPSTSEPWGLVVEEALYFGLPVIVSKSCGSCELIIQGINGFVIDPCDRNKISEVIQMIDQEIYRNLLINIKSKFIENKDLLQVGSYGLF